MTLPAEFEDLTLIEKGIALLDNGNLLNARLEGECKVFLFELKGALIEVFFIPQDKKIEKIEVLSAKDSSMLKERELYFA